VFKQYVPIENTMLNIKPATSVEIRKPMIAGITPAKIIGIIISRE
jgi:hypothetical protein